MFITQVVQNVEPAAQSFGSVPWWAASSLTIIGTLLGALVAFFSAKASDKRKEKRDRTERIMLDTRSVGLEYLDAANAIANIIRAQDDPSRALSNMDFPKAIQSALIDAHAKWGKFELFGHDDALETGKKLNVACTVLAVMAFKADRPTESLEKFELAKYTFMNMLRKASGVGEINLDEPDPETAKKLRANGEAIIDGVAADIIKNFGPKHKKK